MAINETHDLSTFGVSRGVADLPEKSTCPDNVRPSSPGRSGRILDGYQTNLVAGRPA